MHSHGYGLCKILHICHVELVETSSRKAHNLLISYRYARFFDALRMTWNIWNSPQLFIINSCQTPTFALLLDTLICFIYNV